MSTDKDLIEQYKEAQKELEEAEANEERVNLQHSFVSGAIRHKRPDHPEVQQAEERSKRAREAEAELLRQLRERQLFRLD